MSNIKFNNIHTVIKYFAMITYVKLAYLFIFEVSFIKIRSSQLDLGARMPSTFIFCQWINWLELDTATLCQSRSLSPLSLKIDTRSWSWLIWKPGASLFYRWWQYRCWKSILLNDWSYLFLAHQWKFTRTRNGCGGFL